MYSDNVGLFFFMLYHTAATDSLACVTVMKNKSLFSFSDVSFRSWQLNFFLWVSWNHDFAFNLVVALGKIAAYIAMTAWDFLLEFDQSNVILMAMSIFGDEKILKIMHFFDFKLFHLSINIKYEFILLPYCFATVHENMTASHHMLGTD